MATGARLGKRTISSSCAGGRVFISETGGELCEEKSPALTLPKLRISHGSSHLGLRCQEVTLTAEQPCSGDLYDTMHDFDEKSESM
jgi:hypothetical protein